MNIVIILDMPVIYCFKRKLNEESNQENYRKKIKLDEHFTAQKIETSKQLLSKKDLIVLINNSISNSTSHEEDYDIQIMDKYTDIKHLPITCNGMEITKLENMETDINENYIYDYYMYTNNDSSRIDLNNFDDDDDNNEAQDFDVNCEVDDNGIFLEAKSIRFFS